MFPLSFVLLLPLVLFSSLQRVIRPSWDSRGASVRRTIRVGRVPAPALVLIPPALMVPAPRIDALPIPFSVLLREFLLEWTNLREGIPAKISNA